MKNSMNSRSNLLCGIAPYRFRALLAFGCGRRRDSLGGGASRSSLEGAVQSAR